MLRLKVALMTHRYTIAIPAHHSLSFLNNFKFPSTNLNLRPPVPALPNLRLLSSTTKPKSTLMSNNISTMNQEEIDRLEPVFKQKRILRTQVRKALRSMDPSIRSQEDDAIQSIVLDAPWFKSCRRLCAYISCSSLREVDTLKILSEILQNPKEGGNEQMKKKLYVPRVEDKNSYMRMFHISKVDDMIANSMNILEPAPTDSEGNEREDVMQASKPVDLFLLPGLAFDRTGRRLGRGGGYYDTFLKNYQDLARTHNWEQPLLVALCYSLQILDEGVIPVTPHDVPVDALITPTRNEVLKLDHKTRFHNWNCQMNLKMGANKTNNYIIGETQRLKRSIYSVKGLPICFPPRFVKLKRVHMFAYV